MIDLHCHMLPGVDDGAKNMQEAIQMAQVASDEGITHVVLTPHIHQGRYPNDKDSLMPTFRAFCEQLAHADIPLQVALASEIRVAPELLLNGAWRQLPALGRDEEERSVLLLEMPYSHIPPGMEQLLRWLMAQGVRPVIAHPERNREVIAHPSLVSDLLKAGAWLQGTVGAFNGQFGDAVEDVAWDLLHQDAFTYLASDSHGVERRPPEIGLALSRLREHVDEDVLIELLADRPWSIAKSKFANGG